LDALWPGTQVNEVGRGRVFAMTDFGPALEAIQLKPDFTYVKPRADSHVMFIHRHLDDGDAYFLSNRIDRSEVITGSFRVKGRAPQLWDPDTGLTQEASFRIVGDRTEVTVPLDRFGSRFVVFRAPATRDERVEPTYQWRTLATLAGSWPVAFQSGRGAPATATFAKLLDFREVTDPGIRYFSGIATYSHELSIDGRSPTGGSHLWLDLGEVHDLAEVWINGHLAGTAWKPPYRVDISALAEPGRNRLEIRVVNLWVNRLIGDVQPGISSRITFTQADGKVSPNITASEEAIQLRMPYPPDAPLRPSGLIGPVSVLLESRP